MSIIIFTRAIRTGKTTELMNWCKSRNNVAGILMPEVDGKRKILNIKTGETIEAECAAPEKTNEPIINIGHFSFYASAFEKGNEILLQALEDQPRWLVIDELGKLELQKKGFYNAIKAIVDADLKATNVVVVIRDVLLIDAISLFSFTQYRCIYQIQEVI